MPNALSYYSIRFSERVDFDESVDVLCTSGDNVFGTVATQWAERSGGFLFSKTCKSALEPAQLLQCVPGCLPE